MDELTEYKIKLQTLPDGFDRVEYGRPKEGDLFLRTDGTWSAVAQFDFEEDNYFIARKKRTLADWANAQPLLGVLAKMCTGYLQVFTSGFHCMYDNVDRDLIVRAEQCTHEFNGKAIKPVNGKWVDA